MAHAFVPSLQYCDGLGGGVGSDRRRQFESSSIAKPAKAIGSKGVDVGVTLHGKVDIPEEASLPWGVQDVQEEKSKTIHG